MNKKEFIAIWADGSELSETDKKHMANDLDKVLESAERRAAELTDKLERVANDRDDQRELKRYEMARAAESEAHVAALSAERDDLRRQRDYQMRRIESLQITLNTINADNHELRDTNRALHQREDEARRQLAEAKKILAMGRNVGADRDQAYQDAEEIIDSALRGKTLQRFEATAPVDWREADFDHDAGDLTNDELSDEVEP